MRKIILCYGLPASGKSTWAKEQVNTDADETVRVNKDSLREMLNEKNYSHDREGLIEEVQDGIVRLYLEQDKTVIVDNTNLAPRWVKHFSAMAEEFDAVLEIKSFLQVSLATCIIRDKARKDKVGESVIKNMWETHIR